MRQHSRMPRPGAPRAGLAFLALMSAVTGGWALIAPASFFATFPAPGHPWVALLPPYNEHLVRDVGAFNLSFAVLFAWAAVALERRLTQAALVAYLAYAVPHLIYHMRHLAHFPPVDAAAQAVSLFIVVAIPLALLADASRPQRNRPPLVDGSHRS